jgi:hypothetical protein
MKKISKKDNRNDCKPPVYDINSGSKLEITADSALTTFGSKNSDIVTTMFDELINIIPEHLRQHNNYINSALATAHELKPRDSYERMLVTQIIATHTMAMEFLKRSMFPEQTVEGVDTNINRAAKLMRAFDKKTEALMKHRGKSDQKIQVQHINVQDNAQAIVGDVKGAT